MAPERPSSAGTRAGAGNRQGVEAPSPLVSATSINYKGRHNMDRLRKEVRQLEGYGLVGM